MHPCPPATTSRCVRCRTAHHARRNCTTRSVSRLMTKMRMKRLDFVVGGPRIDHQVDWASILASWMTKSLTPHHRRTTLNTEMSLKSCESIGLALVEVEAEVGAQTVVGSMLPRRDKWTWYLRREVVFFAFALLFEWPCGSTSNGRTLNNIIGYTIYNSMLDSDHSRRVL